MANRRTLPDGVKRRVSESKKRASNFKRQREMLAFYDNYHSDGRHRDPKFVHNCRVNYDLSNGRLDMDEYVSNTSTKLAGETIEMPEFEIIHNPVISQVFNAMLGEQIIRPFKPQAIEMGTSYHNAYKKKVTELMREHITQNIIGPAQQRAQSEWLQSNGVTDPFTLNPEQQQQMRQEVSTRTKALTPKEAADFMRNDFQTAVQRQTQQLITYLNGELNIRELQNEGFKHAIITGREYYHIDDINGNPRMSLINPVFFQWGGDQNEEWVQNGDWAKYEQWRSFQSMVTDYSSDFKREDWKKLEDYAEPIGGYDTLGDPRYDKTARQAMFMLTQENGYVPEKVREADIRTRQGQQALAGFYNALSSRWGNSYDDIGFGIREATITFRDIREMYEVVRVENDKKVSYWMAENYTPTKDDIEVFKHHVPDIWEGKVLGSHDPIYTRVRRVPNQHRSIHDPRQVLLPFVGKDYSSPMNNTRNVSPIDMGKAAQKNIDVLKAEIQQEMARDNGKVFAMVTEMKPDNMTWTEFYTQMKVFKTVHLQTNKHGQHPMDSNLIKSIDMSNAQSITQKMAMVEAEKNELIQSMYFNPTRMGMGGQYATTDTTKNNRAASFNQTEGFFDTHTQIVEQAYDMLLNRARFVLKDQPHKLDIIFDDVARANLSLSHNLWNAEIGVKMSLSNSDRESIEYLRANMQALIQNGMSMEGTMDIVLAETAADIRAIVQRESRKLEEKQQMAMQATQEELKTKEEARLKEKQMELESKERIASAKRADDLERTKIQVTQFERQADVDNNNEADSVTKAKLEIASKERIKQAELDLEREKMAMEK